jgi:hypothetical protein
MISPHWHWIRPDLSSLCRLIRWTASDSDLPFSFYRVYHRQLATYIGSPDTASADSDWVFPAADIIATPGYLFLAASLLEKLDSLVHRNLRSVTTQGPNSANFSTNDSANISMGAKPKVLEVANRRVVSTIVDIIGGPIRPSAPELAADGAARRQLFGGMVQIWMRAMVKRTSMWDARGVFVMLDFVESIIYTLCAPPSSQEPGDDRDKPYGQALPLLDTPFILSFVRTILNNADNTVCIMRTIAFLYAQFEA